MFCTLNGTNPVGTCDGVTARKLAWAFGIPRHLKAYPADVPMIWPVAGRAPLSGTFLTCAPTPAIQFAETVLHGRVHIERSPG